MRLIVHDFAGHAFPVQLSRALAQRGHEVLHLYAADVLTPRGSLSLRPSDPANFMVTAVDIGHRFEKYGLLRRRAQESRYGLLLAKKIAEFQPEATLSNAPLGAQAHALRAAHASHSRFVFWMQDLYSTAIGSLLHKKLHGAAAPVAWHYGRMEGRLVRGSDSVVSISPDFVPALRNWGVQSGRIHVMVNWAPLEEMPVAHKSTEWSRKHKLDERFCFVYSGTLGLKHRPELLIRLAQEFQSSGDVIIVVISEGLGADWIRTQITEQNLDNILMLPYQTYADFPDVLGSADVLVTVLHDDAGAFSVPSKVLSYLCASRPILAAIPAKNLAARVIGEAGAGLVVSPLDDDGFISAAKTLYLSADSRVQLGANGRRFAEATFNIDGIADDFERVLRSPKSGASTRRARGIAT